ncbi:MAG: alpha/beta fold hydrolase [Dehalococcoidia bacterium]|nr:alpha/beta fold hydrolase [Dehalococcoidia bacterium]
MGQFASVNGSQIYCEKEGSGPPLVFIHGGLVDSRSWAKQRPLAGDLTMIMPDTRGFGRSEGKLTGLSIKDLVSDVAGLLKDIGVQSAYVLGFSMGGMTAQALAIEHPTVVRGLVLCSTRPGGAPLRAAIRGPQEVPNHVKRAFSPGFVERETAFMERYIAMATENESRGWYDVREAMNSAYQGDDIAKINKPTLIIHARADASIPLAEAEKLNELINDSRLEVVEDSGHTIQVERPDLFNNLLREFVIQCEARQEVA